MSKAVSGKAHGALAGLTLGLAALGLGGCGSSSDEDTNYVEQPVEVLYNRALDNLGQQEYKAAAKGFEEVDRQHPLLGVGDQGRDHGGLRLLSVEQVR